MSVMRKLAETFREAAGKLSSGVPAHITFLLEVYAVGLAVLTGFRLLLLVTELERVSSGEFFLLVRALVMGVRFDTVVSAYVLMVPFLLFTTARALHVESPVVGRAATAYLGCLYGIVFVIASVDIPYFNHFFSRLTSVALNWADSPDFVAGMIVHEVRYALFAVPLIGATALFWRAITKLRREILEGDGDSDPGLVPFVVASLVAAALLFGAARGRLAEKSPIRVGTAYFSANPFLNQLGLNPAFTFFDSVIREVGEGNSPLRLMPAEEALAEVRKQLGVADDSPFDSPIARQVVPAGEPRRANVVLILMEAMSAELMGRFGAAPSLAPNLDRLAAESLSFDRVYSAGIHTYNGIYSTLAAFPALMEKHPMKGTVIHQYSGLADTLRAAGYTTTYFSANDVEFNNANGFLRANGFERIFSQVDYPSDKRLSTLGVPDDYLLEVAAEKIDELDTRSEPFFVMIRTASLHPPLIIPEWVSFRPTSSSKQLQVAEYADWAIGQFMDRVRAKPWFDDTLFVFVADHGLVLDARYSMPMSYHHVPLILHAPALLGAARAVDAVGVQIDVFPTIMGVLNFPYVNNTLGIDLIHGRRPYAYFSNDRELGVLDEAWYLILQQDGGEGLYRYEDRDVHDFSSEQPARVARMRRYAHAMLQTADWMIANGGIGPQAAAAPGDAGAAGSRRSDGQR